VRIPCVVDTKENVDMYPEDPNPCVDDIKLEVPAAAELIKPKLPRPCTVDIKEKDEI
jgi:hypothetical protein